MTLYKLLHIYLSLGFILLASCRKIEKDSLFSDEIQTINTAVVSDDHPGIINMQKRARQIANIKWIPKEPIQYINGYYMPNEVCEGIPYSSVKELDRFVGHEVSFHTFMTAINNPNSVMYTEHVGQPPYCGNNCVTFYGTVCSMAVNYALDLDLPYQSDMYEQLKTFAKVIPQQPENICTGDLLLSPGHVVLIVNIESQESKMGKEISYIDILESKESGTSIKTYDFNSFKRRWEEDGWCALRYLNIHNIQYDPIPFMSISDETHKDFEYNNDLCTSLGDKVSYRKGDNVEIDILSEKFDNLELYKDGVIYSQCKLSGNKSLTFKELPDGLYEAFLSSQSLKSASIYFEVIDINVDISRKKRSTIVSFISNCAHAEYIVICNRDGFRKHIEIISDNDHLLGMKKIRELSSDEYIKVFYKGAYGYVSNSIVDN